MPVLSIIFRVSIFHELVVGENSLPVFLVFHFFFEILLVAKELFNADLGGVEILEHEVLGVEQICGAAGENNVDQLVTGFVAVLRHFVHHLQVKWLDCELGLVDTVQ